MNENITNFFSWKDTHCRYFWTAGLIFCLAITRTTTFYKFVRYIFHNANQRNIKTSTSPPHKHNGFFPLYVFPKKTSSVQFMTCSIYFSIFTLFHQFFSINLCKYLLLYNLYYLSLIFIHSYVHVFQNCILELFLTIPIHRIFLWICRKQM